MWEHVLKTDFAAPSTAVLGLMSDRRVAQYWDPDRVLSADLVAAVNADPDRYGIEKALPPDFIAWDVVAVFSRADTWDEELPVPRYYGGPVVGGIEETRSAIANAINP